jgi:hypothetical protein
MEQLTHLICWHCGAKKAVFIPYSPRFGFELAGWAKDVGMVGYVDQRHRRTLLFCNPDHARAEMTKTGMFRLRAKGLPPPPKEQK